MDNVYTIKISFDMLSKISAVTVQERAGSEGAPDKQMTYSEMYSRTPCLSHEPYAK